MKLSFLKRLQIEDIVASIERGYEKGKKHNIIVLAEGVMLWQMSLVKLKEAGDTNDLRVTELGHINVVVHQLLATVYWLLVWERMPLNYLKKGIGGVAVKVCNEKNGGKPNLGNC